jgi:hypothetical protein
MRMMILALAAVIGLAAVPAVTTAPAEAQGISVRIGGDRHHDGYWRHRHRDRVVVRTKRPRYFASCKTTVRERHGPVVVKRTINRC